MAVNAVHFIHQNCTHLTRFNLLHTSIFLRTTSRCKHFSTKSKYCIFALEMRRDSHICCQGVTDKQHIVRGGVNGLVFRCTNTDATTPAGGESRFQKFRKLLYDFYLGGKNLFQDVKLTWKIRRKLRANSWNYDVLERKELWTMFKTQKNLTKTFPIVVLSCLPVVGYLGPIIGFLRPRQFLSNHFWTAKQKDKFRSLDNKEKAVCSHAIFEMISKQTKELENEEHQLLHKITSKADVNYDSSLENFSNSFSSFSNGIFALENLQRTHLQKLCSFWILRSWWPSFMLERNLGKEMIIIHKDDVALVREGIQTLNEKELKEACHVRGLNTSNISSKDLQVWLQSWLDLSKNISENETSFLAHHAVFKTMNSQEALKDNSTL